MTPSAPPDFDDPDLALRVERLREAEVDALPFGAIRLDSAGVVQAYSQGERRLSGSGGEPRLGRDFFAEVAPCMDTPQFRGRIDRALAAGHLDLEFGHVGDFADREREIVVRVQPASVGGMWIFMRREG